MALARASLLFPALLAATALVLWLPDARQPTAEKSQPPSDADYYMEQFQLLQSDTQGRSRHWLRAAHLAQHDGITRLRQPELILSTDGDDTTTDRWRLRAASGRIEHQTRVFLQGDVQIQHMGASTSPKLQIFTPSLQLDLDWETAETVQAVTVLAPQGRLQARGLRLSLKEHRLQLLAQVRGVYAQP